MKCTNDNNLFSTPNWLRMSENWLAMFTVKKTLMMFSYAGSRFAVGVPS